MFSSQLLRILQTIPSDVKHDSCVFDTAEQGTIMKENPNATFYDVQSFEANTLALESKEIYLLDTSESDIIPFSTYVKGGEKGWNPFVDDFSMDNETVNHPIKDTNEKDADSLSCDMKDKDTMLEHGRSNLIEEFAHCSENLSQDSSLPCLPALELSEKALKMHADEKVLDSELPELMVCYKEVNYHIVKDICVDEGLPVRDKIVAETLREDSFSKHPDDGNKFNTSKEGEEDEMSKHESYVNFIDQGMPEKSLDNAGNCDFEECSSVTNPSKEETIIDKTLPIQEFGTPSFLRSFITSLDNDEDKTVQQPDQAPLGKEVTGNQTVSSTETELEKDTSLSGTDDIYSDSPALVLDADKNKDSKDLSVDSGLSHDHAEKDHIGNPHMNDSFSSNKVQCIRDKDKVDESVQIESIISNSKNASVEGRISQDSKDSEEALYENVSRLVSHLQRDMGESSFSGAGLITYSGPIANAGSQSLRSDGSATSCRSFAFPILPSEWNSSPVRMAKADKKRLRKHKGWRSGLLCCRF